MWTFSYITIMPFSYLTKLIIMPEQHIITSSYSNSPDLFQISQLTHRVSQDNFEEKQLCGTYQTSRLYKAIVIIGLLYWSRDGGEKSQPVKKNSVPRNRCKQKLELGITTHQEKDILSIVLRELGKKYWIPILHNKGNLIPNGMKT